MQAHDTILATEPACTEQELRELESASDVAQALRTVAERKAAHGRFQVLVLNANRDEAVVQRQLETAVRDAETAQQRAEATLLRQRNAATAARDDMDAQPVPDEATLERYAVCVRAVRTAVAEQEASRASLQQARDALRAHHTAVHRVRQHIDGVVARHAALCAVESKLVAAAAAAAAEEEEAPEEEQQQEAAIGSPGRRLWSRNDAVAAEAASRAGGGGGEESLFQAFKHFSAPALFVPPLMSAPEADAVAAAHDGVGDSMHGLVTRLDLQMLKEHTRRERLYDHEQILLRMREENERHEAMLQELFARSRAPRKRKAGYNV